ncbi:DUF1593 domain-containing protein [Sphingomonas naphthae]|uniref:DUF1593 domain-containing protein n=1 Tax=Sphingomonas naphthae TaxID=1813468 RepID=A0ABY7TLP1_9SPHN|nr:nucleoside hydrolase-like domain-containing protein [Sphingomonas naphthae]WCT74152.1 DUF1593 domain-containing protein [Sphingomonas naphthae]
MRAIVSGLMLLAGGAGVAAGQPPAPGEPFRYGNQRVATIQAPGTPEPAPAGLSESPRVRMVVLTDVGNEPDDSQSLVRLLTYANEMDIEAIVATTSASLTSENHPELIHAAIAAYGKVRPNLMVHAKGWPEASALAARVWAGSAGYGMAQVGKGHDTPGSRAIVAAVDSKDTRPLWVTVWGGAADLAQALWSVRATRDPAAVKRFVARLRVHAISDQDDSGPWIRQNFPDLFWIGSIHAFREYAVAGWAGIGFDIIQPDPAVNTKLVDHDWQKALGAIGPLGAAYPLSTGIMEGDTPSFLGLIPNGLNVPSRPDYGGWGGRHAKVSAAYGLYADASDTVKGLGGIVERGARATVWRWREPVQNDFLARMRWSVSPRFADANHPPAVVLNGQGGIAPLVIRACAGARLALSAAGTSDPDSDTLTYRWWQYREATFMLRTTQTIEFVRAEGPEAELIVPTPSVNAPADYHVILEVRDGGQPALTRYRRVVLSIQRPPLPGAACPARG